MINNKKSKTQEILSLKGNFISGVHNYCDRWCERCEFNDRCRVYAKEKLYPPDKENFMEELTETLGDIKEMMEEWVEKEGIDFEKFKQEAITEAEEKEKIDYHQHPLAKKAYAYQKQVRAFFDKHTDEFNNKEQHMNQMLNIGVGEKQVQSDAALIKDCFEIINWYLFFIEIKLIRAISSRADEKDDEPDPDYPPDSDGSCKISLIAMDKTIGAWEILLHQFPDLGDECIYILSQITTLRSDAEREFPNARKFVRIGFDTGGK